MRIDAHQHFWQPASVEYAWMRGLAGEAARRLVRPVLPAELAPILAHHRIDRTVLVQAATNDAETSFLLSLAEQHELIAGAVVWLDLEREDFERELGLLRGRPKFLGIRPMIQDIPDPGWMLRPSVRRALAVLEAEQVCFDFLIKPHQLAATLELLRAFPRLRAVVDHLAKPNIQARELEPWGALLRRASEFENVYCKLSGMVTECHHGQWVPADLSPFVEHALRCFGPERSMFGSDWPVCTLAASYHRVIDALEWNLAAQARTGPALEQIFGGTAAEFYRLPLATPTTQGSVSHAL